VLGFFGAVRDSGLMGVLEVLESLPDAPPDDVLDLARANFARQDDAAIRACVTALTDAVLLDDIADLERVDIPTLVVGHHGDALHPWSLAEAYAEALPNAKLVGYETSAEATAAVTADLLAEFFAEL
jgi:pimeloyl-ACP methyl ester carboxylesterase